MNEDVKRKKHSLELKKPPVIWDHGFPLGNGDLGINHFFKGSESTRFELYQESIYGINKYGIRDRRMDPTGPNIPHEKVCQCLEEGDDEGFAKLVAQHSKSKTPYPCPKPAGQLIITDCTAEKLYNFQENLLIEDATIETNYEYSFGKSNVKSFICAEKNVLAVRYEDTSKHISDPFIECKTFNRIISVHRWIDTVDPTMTAALHDCDDKFIWIDHTLPDGLRYITMATVKHADFQTKVNGFRAEAVLKSYVEGEIEIYLTTVTSTENSDPLNEAKKILSDAVNAGWENLYCEHKQWWNNFWSASSIEFSERENIYEQLWYFGLYCLGSASRPGKLPPPLPGLWNRYDNPGWRGDYFTDSNLELTFWPIYTSNHLELGQSLWKFYLDMIPKLKEETKARYNADGIKIPCTHDDIGREYTRFPYCYQFSGGGRMGLLFWWAYEFSQDVELLKNTIYPLIKEIAIFYASYMNKGPDNKYHIWPSKSPEQTQGANFGLDTDPVIDIAVAKSMFQAAIKAAAILNLDQDLSEVWQEYLANMPDYKTGINYRGREVWLDTADACPDRFLFHSSLLYPVFPCGEIDEDDKYNIKEVALNTLQAMEQQCHGVHNHFLLTYTACVAARLGQIDRALELLDRHTERGLMENGLFSCLRRDVFTEIYEIESTVSPVAVINEMLLQSHNGIIRVFPATPGNWNVSFKKFRTRGGFLVSASHLHGSRDPGPVYNCATLENRPTVSGKGIGSVQIESTVGGLCKVKNPWPNQPVTLTEINSEKKTDLGVLDIIEIDTQSGYTYMIELKPESK